MRTRKTMNVSITPQQRKLVDRLVKTGRFQSASEVVRTGLRMVDQDEVARRKEVADIRAKIEEGWQQLQRGEVVDGETYFKRHRERTKAWRKKTA